MAAASIPMDAPKAARPHAADGPGTQMDARVGRFEPLDDGAGPGSGGPFDRPRADRHGRQRLPNGRLRDLRLDDSSRNAAMAMHVCVAAGPFFNLAFIVPIVIWLVRGTKAAFTDDHGREILNLYISTVLVFLISIPVGTLIFWPWLVINWIGTMRAATAASNGEFFRYPMIFRLVR